MTYKCTSCDNAIENKSEDGKCPSCGSEIAEERPATEGGPEENTGESSDENVSM